MDDLPQTKKSLGQHWLKDADTLSGIVKAADISSTDTVLEIGAGGGTLTIFLVQSAGKVIALELDTTLASLLRANFAKANITNLTVNETDVRKFDFNTLPAHYKIVANIPYYLTANLLRLLIDTDNKPSVAVLLVQKEVAQRVAAGPGQMSFISLAVQFYYTVTLGQEVPARLFTPPPKVDSQVLILKNRGESAIAGADEQGLLRLAKLGFSQPRKTILNNLIAGLDIKKVDIELAIAAANLKTNQRAQELSISDWHNLQLAILASNK